MRRLTGSVVLVLAVAFAGAGCDPQTTNTPTTPTTPTTTTESFAGSVSVNGAVTFQFVTASSGYVQATLKTLTPDVVAIGLALGTWNGVTCQAVLINDQAAAGITVTGSVAAASLLCVRIYDIGQLTQPNTFEITVIHP